MSWTPAFTETAPRSRVICPYCECPGVHTNVDECLIALYKLIEVTDPTFVKKFPQLLKRLER